MTWVWGKGVELTIDSKETGMVILPQDSAPPSKGTPVSASLCSVRALRPTMDRNVCLTAASNGSDDEEEYEVGEFSCTFEREYFSCFVTFLPPLKDGPALCVVLPCVGLCGLVCKAWMMLHYNARSALWCSELTHLCTWLAIRFLVRLAPTTFIRVPLHISPISRKLLAANCTFRHTRACKIVQFSTCVCWRLDLGKFWQHLSKIGTHTVVPIVDFGMLYVDKCNSLVKKRTWIQTITIRITIVCKQHLTFKQHVLMHYVDMLQSDPCFLNALVFYTYCWAQLNQYVKRNSYPSSRDPCLHLMPFFPLLV